MEKLFYGAHVTVCRQIGMTPLSSPRIHVAADAAAAAFADWTKQIGEDIDVGRDCRMMVPVFYDLEREKTKVWVMLGWSRREPGNRTLPTPPSYAVYDAQGKAASDDEVNVQFRLRIAVAGLSRDGRGLCLEDSRSRGIPPALRPLQDALGDPGEFEVSRVLTPDVGCVKPGSAAGMVHCANRPNTTREFPGGTSPGVTHHRGAGSLHAPYGL